MEKLLTVKEVANFLRCHPQSVYGNSELPYIKIPGIGIRYKESELSKYIEQKSIKTRSLMTSSNSAKLFKLTNLDDFDRIFLNQNKGGNCGSMNGKKTRWNYGFGSVYIRKTKQGKVRWYADYKADGERVREVVKNAQCRAEAVLYLQEKVAKVFNQAHGLSKKKHIVFEELAERYLVDYAKLMKRSFESDMYIIRAHLNPFFGTMKINQISCLLLEKYRAARLKKEVKKSTVNRELAIMSRIFSIGIDWGFATENPVKKIKFFSEKDNSKERILTAEEEARLFKTCAEHLRPILKIALSTGMRRGEILNLKWSQIDFEKRVIRIEKTKSGKTRYVYINSELFKVLKELRAKNEKKDFAFVNPETGLPYRDVKRAFKSACRRANINNLRLHDLRHTFASRLIESGVDLITVKELLGHSTVKMTERYTHPNHQQKRRAVEFLIEKSTKKPEKPDELAHICHTDENESSGLDATDSFLIN